MSYQLKVLRDYPIAFWPLDETSGSVAYDISGCGNNGTYNGTFTAGLLPLVSGGNNATEISDLTSLEFTINNNYYGVPQTNPFGTYYSSDNDFSVEFWFYPISGGSSPKYNTQMKLIEGQGFFSIYIEKSTLFFEVYGDDSTTYKISKYLDFDSKSFHVVAVYSGTGITMYIEGLQSETLTLPSTFKFPQGSSNPTIKIPSTDSASGDKFLIDAVAIYRYALSYESILTHLSDGHIQIEPIQVAYPDGGLINQVNDTKLFKTLSYTYPQNKDFYSFLDSITSQKLEYDDATESLKFLSTLTGAQSVVLNDIIYTPPSSATSSKIEWRGDAGISVEVSTDGDQYNYYPCENGGVIPIIQAGTYNGNATQADGTLYIKITISTPDVQKMNPSFSFFAISMYNNKEVPFENSSEFISSAGQDYYVGTLNYPLLSRHKNNGIKSISGPFKISTDKEIKAIEFFYTPENLYPLQTSRYSILFSPATKYNYISNPSFEINYDNWNISGGNQSQITKSLSSDVPSISNAGSKSLKVSTSGSWYYVSGPSAYLREDQRGKNFTFSAYVKTESTQFSLAVQGGTGAETFYPTDTNWHRYDVTVSAENTAPLLVPYLQFPSGSYNTYIDCTQLEEGSSTTPYFDGSVSGYSWLDASNNSFSIQGYQTEYSWVQSTQPYTVVGSEIRKKNIDSIYVNGINKTTETALIDNVFSVKNIQHVIINFTNTVTGNILLHDMHLFQGNPYFALKGLYQNITLYEENISGAMALDHYNLYTAKASASVKDSVIKIVENDPKYYNNDWVVVSSI